MSYTSHTSDDNDVVARLTSVLATGGVLVLMAWLAANDGGYFSREFYTGAVCAVTLAGLVILIDWDQLVLPGASILPLIFCAAVLFWTGTSVVWSISPGSSMDEFSRVSIYLASFFLVLSGSKRRADILLSTMAFTALGTALAIFALLAKISPEYSQEFAVAGGRIMGSLGYWNALAIFMVVSALLCLWLASSPEIPRIGRIAATSALFILGITLFFTISRGGMAIGAISVLFWLSVSSNRLASLLSLLAAMIPSGLIIWRTYMALPSLHSSEEALRIDAGEGRQFALMLIAGVVAAGVLKAISLMLPARIPATDKWRAYTIIIWVLVIAIAAAGGLSQKQRISDKLDEWQSRAESSSTSGNDESVRSEGISRLVTLDGERLEHWRIGITNFQEHPLAGTGAGTYRFANLQLQSGVGLARDPHSIWIRFLSDQGIIGFMLLLGLTGTIAYGLVRPLIGNVVLRRDGLYLSLLVAMGAWLADSSLEWNWELPAVAMAFFFLAGTAFRLAESDKAAAVDRNITPLSVPVWMRMAAMALAVLLSALFLAFIGSEEFADRAQERLASGDLQAAATNARRARQLNLFDVRPLVIKSQIASADSDFAEARQLMFEAIEMEPEQSSHYKRLALIEFYDLEETEAGIASLTRALDLDPQRRELHILLHQLHAKAEIFRDTGEMPVVQNEDGE